MLDYQQCADLVASSRDKRSKPVANNTRVEKRGDNAYALKLHATDIATYWENGTIEINSGGYRTVTTAARLGGYVTRHQYSERGTWYVRAEPNANDPEPLRGERKIPKPFHALNPGDEPEKSSEGCLIGTYNVVTEPVRRLVSFREVEQGVAIDEPYEGGGSYFAGYRTTDETTVTWYGERAWDYNEQRPELPVADHVKREQCPHCNLFERQHAAWYIAMHGASYGKDRGKGYEQMVAMLEKYGTREAWQDAYLDDFRAAREQRIAHRAWVDRNRVTFEDHMEITSEGYAKRPDLKQIAREQRKAKKIAKKRSRVDKFISDAVDALANGLAMPGAGDCFGCSFRAEDKSVEPMGSDHLEQHIDESYFVPSMYVNAMRNHGYQDAGIYMILAMDLDAQTMGGEKFRHHERTTVARALRKYLYQRLVPEHAIH